MRSHALASLAILTLLTASAADAKSSFTPPLGAELGRFVTCVVQNLGTKTRSVTITLRGSDGSALASGSYDVAPGQVMNPASESGFGNYCEFEGLGRTVRGFVALTEGNTTWLVLPAGR